MLRRGQRKQRHLRATIEPHSSEVPQAAADVEVPVVAHIEDT